MEKPVANINYLNLFAKATENEEKILKKNASKPLGLQKKLEAFEAKPHEKKVKKTTLREILSLDCLKLKITPVNTCDKNLENNLF